MVQVHLGPPLQFLVSSTFTAAEVRRLEGLGATRYDHQQERGYDFWVLRDPGTTSSASSRSTFPTCSPNARAGQTSGLPKLALR
jgi:hypothetical protein